MSTVAAGAYIRTLREARHLSRAKLAALAHTHESQIERIERGEQDTRGSLLIAIVQAVRGNLDQIGRLLLDEAATADDGRRLAQEWLMPKERQVLERFATGIPDEHVAAVITHIGRLQADSEALIRLRGYLERLIEEYLDEQQAPSAVEAAVDELQPAPSATTTSPPPPPKRRRLPWRRHK
jgi:transcriptional regulator with XRE-family HTH domain